MKGIPREARKITYSTDIRNLIKKLVLTADQKAVLVGNILGDGHLEPNWSKTNYKLKINHAVKHKDYLLWKYEIFKEWVLTAPKLDKWNNSFQFRTISHREITELRNKFYQDGKKIIPDDIRDYLKNPLTLAVWFMDDGNAIIYKKKLIGYHINSQSFTTNENKALIRSFSDLYGLHCSLQLNHGKHRIYIPAKDRDNFKNIIVSYMLPSMQYKLG